LPLNLFYVSIICMVAEQLPACPLERYIVAVMHDYVTIT